MAQAVAQAAASVLGIGLATLYRRLKEIEADTDVPEDEGGDPSGEGEPPASGA